MFLELGYTLRQGKVADFPIVFDFKDDQKQNIKKSFGSYPASDYLDIVHPFVSTSFEDTYRVRDLLPIIGAYVLMAESYALRNWQLPPKALFKPSLRDIKLNIVEDERRLSESLSELETDHRRFEVMKTQETTLSLIAGVLSLAVVIISPILAIFTVPAVLYGILKHTDSKKRIHEIIRRKQNITQRMYSLNEMD